MKKKNFVHCPKPGCDRPLRGSWNDYLTGEMHPKTGLPVYQCPHCHLKFTADSFKANAVPVPNNDNDVVLYDVEAHKVMDIIPGTMKFTDGEFSYVHVPITFCTQGNIKCYSFKARGMTSAEIEAACEAAFKGSVEVMR